jgi:acetyl esterase/lipase
MTRSLLLCLTFLFYTCQKEDTSYPQVNLLENSLGIAATPSPFGENSLFFENIAYGSGARNILDVFLPKKVKPVGVVVFFHGGGFVSGDKSDAYADFLKNTMLQLLNEGVAIVSANYTLINSPNASGVISSLNDGEMVLNFIKNKLEVLNIPKNKILLAGVSAGAGIAQWNGYREASNDQVQGIVALAAQSTYNLYEWENVFLGFKLDELRNSNLDIENIFQLFYNGTPTQTDLEAVDYRAFMDSDDPPVYILNQAGDKVIDAEGNLDFDVLYHSFLHGDYLRKKAIEVRLTYSGVFVESPEEFILRILRL